MPIGLAGWALVANTAKNDQKTEHQLEIRQQIVNGKQTCQILP